VLRQNAVAFFVVTAARNGFELSVGAQRTAITLSHTMAKLLNFGKKQILHKIYFV